MKKQKVPDGAVSDPMNESHTPGSNLLQILLFLIVTVSKKHPYRAVVLALLLLCLFYPPKPIRQFIHEIRQPSQALQYGQQGVNSERIMDNPPVSTEIQGDFTSPSERYLPFTPKWAGHIKGLKEDGDLLLAMQNPIGQLCMYHVHVDGNTWDLIHRLGNEFGDIGQEYKVWLFAPAPGANVQDGLQLFLPAGHRVSPIRRYIRRANLPGEK